jgi:Porin subfamily
MTRAQGIGSLAAIGSLTAMIALQTGLPAARADELQDLIANQQLLQQRIDQLAKAQANEQQAAVEGGPVVAGQPSIAGSFPRSFLIPGTNTSIAIGGYIKLDMTERIHGGSPNPGNGSTDNFGLSSVAGLPLNLKGPPGTIFATPAYSASARSNWVFQATAAESRLRVETRTPTDYGQVTTVLEFDFEGCNSDTINCAGLNDGTFSSLARLRLAYATWGGFFAGQSFVPVNDVDAHPELFDFSGDAGQFGFSRAPWLGYTWQLPYGTSFQVAAVEPMSGGFTPIGALYDNAASTGTSGGISLTPAGSPGGFAIDPFKSTMPDANFVLRNNQPWGHVTAGFILARETLDDGAFLNQNFLGYGGGLSGNVKPNWFGWAKDNFGWNFYAGEGLGHYANPPGNGEPTTVNPLATNWGLVGEACNVETGAGCYGNAAGTDTGGATRANAALVDTQTFLSYGAEGNYQHWWLDNLRTTISGGFQTSDIPTSLVTVAPGTIPFNTLSANSNALNYNKTLVTAHANLIWSPVAFIDTGLEFSWGHRLTILGASASTDIVDYSFKVKF